MFDIPLTGTTLDEEEVEAAARVLRSKWLTMGEEVAKFEREFADAIGAQHAVAVTNGTTALEIVFAALDIGPGDEVIMPAITFVACFNAARRAGASVILADVTSETDLTVDPADIARKVTPKTRLIVPMPYGGFCPEMPAILDIANRAEAAVVEDACHAPLAELGGRKIGTFGRAAAWSFFGNKNMTTGEGGMITTDDEQFAAKCRLMRSHGITRTTWDRARGHAADYDVELTGTNARLDEIRAAIGRVQLRKLPAATRRRSEVAVQLREAVYTRLGERVVIPFASPRGTPAHHLFVVLLPENCNRAGVMQRMAELGVQTSVHYRPLHDFSATGDYFARNGRATELTLTTRIAPRLLTLPLGPDMTDEHCARVADALTESITAAEKATPG